MFGRRIFGKILLHKDIGGRNRRTCKEDYVPLNCNDEYYKNIGKSVDANGNAISESFPTVPSKKKVRDRRITENIVKYEDTREDGIKGETAEMPAEFGMCYEKTELNGWSFFNQLTNKQEMAISPAAGSKASGGCHNHPA